MKLKSLAEEARIIRHEEKRQSGALRFSLRWHRIWDVRREQRASYLAYGFIRGRSYLSIEPRPHEKPTGRFAGRVAELVKVFGPSPSSKQEIVNAVQRWIDMPSERGSPHPGVMTPGDVGATPTDGSTPG